MPFHHHTIYTRFIVCLISVFIITSVTAQSVEKLVTFHTKTNTYLNPEKCVKIGDNVCTISRINNTDTLFVDNESVDTKLNAVNTGSVLLNRFDKDHNLEKTGIISSNYDDQCGYVSTYFYNDKLYVFTYIDGTQLRYNGNVVWEGKEEFQQRYYTMTVLDSDLNFVEAKCINQWNSGFEGIAFGDNRMYLFGYLNNTPGDEITADTVEIDGHNLVNLVPWTYTTTMFMLTYDLATYEVINEVKINALSHLLTYTSSIKVAPEGSVFQLLTSESIGMTIGVDTFYMNFLKRNTVLLKYNKEGDLVDFVSFWLPENAVDLGKMELTSEGDVVLYGLAEYGLGINDSLLVEFHLPRAAVILKLSGDDLGVIWYDYFAVIPGSTTSVRVGGMSIDAYDNIYFLTSHGINIPLAEDRSGKILDPGNHIYKYSVDGERLSDNHTYSRSGNQFDFTAVGVDTLLTFRGMGGIVGTKDTITGLTKQYINELLLYEYILNKNISSLTDNGVSPTLQVFPNPVSSSDIITIMDSDGSSATLHYEIYNMMGIKCGGGYMDDFGRIDLAGQRLSHGLYLIRMGDKRSRKQIKILVE